ncbi:phage holin family protein [Owenweeksia hongkongensis]|uniref:phage holin family protein n=1 Tax=Owenweeksia hongkongensis TaxID=253245 RepID=UPI003A8CD3FF
MNTLIIKLIVNTLSVFITAWILGDSVALSGFGTAILVALVLAVFNVTLKPILVFFTLPATLVTFGLFLFVINALIIMAADALISGFYVANFWWALLFSLVLSLINSMLFSLGDGRSRERG